MASGCSDNVLECDAGEIPENLNRNLTNNENPITLNNDNNTSNHDNGGGNNAEVEHTIQASDAGTSNTENQAGDTNGEIEIAAQPSEPKKGLTNKAVTVTDDLNKELFPLQVSVKRRKDKFKQYKSEEFDFSLSSKKQSGLTTPRPVRWTLSIEKYLRDFEPKFSWCYKTNQKTKKYSESIVVIEHETKPVNIHIYYYTGVIIVTGENSRKWIEIEFPKIQKVFQDVKQPDLGEASDWSLQEVEMIWAKCEELETAVNTHDVVIQKIMERAQATELKLLEVGNAFECKMAAITKLAFDDYEESLKKFKNDLEGKFTEVHNKIDRCNTFITNSIKPAEPDVSNELEAKIENLESTLTQKLESSVSQQVDCFIKFGAFHDAEEKAKLLESELKSSDAKISSLKDDVQHHLDEMKNNLEKMNENMLSIKKQLSGLKNDSGKYTKRSNIAEEQQSEDADDVESTPPALPNNQHVEIIMCFDSNGKHIERKRLWKVRGSAFWRCGTLHTVSQQVAMSKISSSKYFMINVGCNDLDEKDPHQVLGELQLLIDQIREKFEDIKIIIGEITPRRDDKDLEVIEFNKLLNDYVKTKAYLYTIDHSNLRTPGWSLYADDKHIDKKKMGVYAGNIIRSLKVAYKISNKSELFVNEHGKKPNNNDKKDAWGISNNVNTRPNDTYQSQNEVHNRANQFRPPESNFKTTVYDPWGTTHHETPVQQRLQYLASYDPSHKNQPSGFSDISRNRKYELMSTLQDAIMGIQKALT